MEDATTPWVRFLIIFYIGAWLMIVPSAFAEEEVPSYRLGTGDKIHVTVFGHEDLSGEFDVDGTGNISFPLVGTVALGGLTIDRAEAVIRSALRPDYLIDPRVSIRVLNYRPFYILGEVNEPGSYPYVNGMTVMEAVALAGGFTYRAREDNVVIIRGGADKSKEEKARQATQVLPGDIIKVPERFF